MSKAESAVTGTSLPPPIYGVLGKRANPSGRNPDTLCYGSSNLPDATNLYATAEAGREMK